MPRKIVVIHNMDLVISLFAEMEVFTKKFDNLTKIMNTIHQLTLVCVGRGTDHTTASYHLTFTHVIQPKAKNFQKQ